MSKKVDYYIYYNGWSDRYILPIRDIDPGCDMSWSSLSRLKVRYEFEDEDDNVITYAQLITDLGSPRCRGRILYDYKNDVSFISVWGSTDAISRDDLIRVGRAYGGLALNAYYVIFNNKERNESMDYFENYEKPTLLDVINGRINIELVSDNSDSFALHLMDAGRKWDKTHAFRRYRGELNGGKLGRMTNAEYNSLIHQEGIDGIIDRILNEKLEMKKNIK